VAGWSDLLPKLACEEGGVRGSRGENMSETVLLFAFIAVVLSILGILG